MNKNKINNRHLLDSNLISGGLNKNRRGISRNKLTYYNSANEWI